MRQFAGGSNSAKERTLGRSCLFWMTKADLIRQHASSALIRRYETGQACLTYCTQ